MEYQVKYLIFLIDNNKYNDNDDALRVGLGGWRRGCDVLTFEYCPTCPIYLLSDDGNTFAICICYQGLQLGDDDDGGDDGDAGDSDDDDDGDTFGLVALQPQPRPASWSKRWQLGAQQLALLGKRKYATDIHNKLAKHQQLTNSQVDNCDPNPNSQGGHSHGVANGGFQRSGSRGRLDGPFQPAGERGPGGDHHHHHQDLLFVRVNCDQ